MIQTHKVEPHWSYLLAVERDLEELSRYVEFDSRNFGAFGIEIARLLLACGAEVDIVCNQVCRKLDPASTAASINAYKDKLLAVYQNLPDFEVVLPRFGLTLHPWDEWRKQRGVPLWWTAYNKTKHERHTQYHLANLHNALNAAAALFVMNLYLYREKAMAGELLPLPQILRVGEAHYGGLTMGPYELASTIYFSIDAVRATPQH